MIRSRNLGWATARLRLAEHVHDPFAADEVQANISGRISRPNQAGAELVILWDSINILEHDQTLHPAIPMRSGQIYLGASRIESLVLTHNHPGWMFEDFPYPPSRIKCMQGNQTSLRFRTETGEDVTFIPDFDHQLKLVLPQLIRCLGDEASINASVLDAVMSLLPEAEKVVFQFTREKPIIVQCLLAKANGDDWDGGSVPGFLVNCRSKYYFFEQGHLDGSLTLEPLSPPYDSCDLTSCQLTLPASSAASESTRRRWTQSMPTLDIQYSPTTTTPFFNLSFENKNWTIRPRYGVKDSSFELSAESFLFSSYHDIDLNSALM